MKKYIYLILFLFLMPFNAYAANDVNIVCDKNRLSANEEANCNITVTNLNFIPIDITGKVTVGDNLSIIESSYNSSIWLSLDSNFNVSDINLIRHNTTQISSINVASFKIKASKNVNGGNSFVKFQNIAIGNTEYNSVELTCLPNNISFTSSTNTLSSLTVNNISLDINKNNNFTIDSEDENVKIEAIATNNKATIKGIGTYTLNYGKNVFNINVIAENGASKTYTVNINRKDNRSTDNTLKKLTIGKEEINIDSQKYNYNLTVDSSVDKISILAELSDIKSSFVKGYGSRTVSLNYGNNVIYVKTKSENGMELTYTININRKDNRSNNNYLKEIILSEGKIAFDPKITEYSISVSYDTNYIEVDGIAEDSKSKIELVGNNNLSVGSNELIIKVTAENGDIKEYKIVVTRSEKTIEETNSIVKNIEIDGHNISFNSDIYSYVVTTNEKTLDIKVSLYNNNYKYEIKGNDNLKHGSVVSIVISDSKGYYNTYKINIVNKKSNNIEEEKSSSSVLLIVLLIISVMINAFLIIFLLKYKIKK